MVGTSIYMSGLVHVSMLEAKTIFCKLLLSFVDEVDPFYFWMTLRGVFVVYFLINYFLVDCFLDLVSKQMDTKNIPIRETRALVDSDTFTRRTRRGTAY